MVFRTKLGKVLACILLLMVMGCGGGGDKGKNKDKDVPKPPEGGARFDAKLARLG